MNVQTISSRQPSQKRPQSKGIRPFLKEQKKTEKTGSKKWFQPKTVFVSGPVATVECSIFC